MFKLQNMDHAIKVFFGHRANYYSAFVTIIHEFETDYIHIEFLDKDIIETFDGPYLTYVGEKGYQKLPAYRLVYLRPILNSIGYIIENAQYISNNQNNTEIIDEEFIRKN